MHRDVEILRNSPICKYYRNKYLEEDLVWFQNKNYQIYDLNCVKWTKSNMHQELKKGLNFPDYYGGNFDAFDDCLNDLKDINHKGVVIVFRRFDAFYDNDREYAEAILDIICRESRVWLLSEKKLFGFVQSNNPNLFFPKLGAVSSSWNNNEWLNKDRE